VVPSPPRLSVKKAVDPRHRLRSHPHSLVRRRSPSGKREVVHPRSRRSLQPPTVAQPLRSKCWKCCTGTCGSIDRRKGDAALFGLRTLWRLFDANALWPSPSSFGPPGSPKLFWASAFDGKSRSWSISTGTWVSRRPSRCSATNGRMRWPGTTRSTVWRELPVSTPRSLTGPAMTRLGAAPIRGSGGPTLRLTERTGDAPHARQGLPCASLAGVQTGPHLGPDQRPRVPGQPPARPPGYSFRPPGPPPGQATRCDRPKSRRISRRSRTRPSVFRSETAFVRFLSPPLYARRAIHGPGGLFFWAASCRGPVLVTGSTSEETAATSLVAAGSVFSYGSSLKMRTLAVPHLAAQPRRISRHTCSTASPPGGRCLGAASDDVVEAMIAHHELVRCRLLRRVSKPLRDDMAFCLSSEPSRGLDRWALCMGGLRLARAVLSSLEGPLHDLSHDSTQVSPPRRRQLGFRGGGRPEIHCSTSFVMVSRPAFTAASASATPATPTHEFRHRASSVTSPSSLSIAITSTGSDGGSGRGGRLRSEPSMIHHPYRLAGRPAAADSMLPAPCAVCETWVRSLQTAAFSAGARMPSARRSRAPCPAPSGYRPRRHREGRAACPPDCFRADPRSWRCMQRRRTRKSVRDVARPWGCDQPGNRTVPTRSGKTRPNDPGHRHPAGETSPSPPAQAARQK
jgi:hypothetical protein